MWNSSTYLARELGIRSATTTETRMACNGGLVAMELASAYLTAHDATAALLTAADTWPPAIADRWRSSKGLILGDGASAIVLSRLPGWAIVRALRITTDPDIEALLRGLDHFGLPGRFVNLQRRADEFQQHVMPEDELWRRRDKTLREVVGEATDVAGIEVGAIQHVALPFLAWPLLRRELLETLGIRVERTTWEYGRHVGHLGAGDQFAGLHHIATSGRVKPDDHILAIGVGGGYTWGALVLRVLTPPNY